MFEMIEYYEPVTRLIVANNVRLGVRAWLALARLLKRVCLSVCLSVFLSVCLFVCLSVCLSVRLSVFLSACMCLHTFNLNLTIYFTFNRHFLFQFHRYFHFQFHRYFHFQFHRLEYLDVRRTSLDESTMPLLCRVLKLNCTLRVLHLEDNHLSGILTRNLGMTSSVIC